MRSRCITYTYLIPLLRGSSAGWCHRHAIKRLQSQRHTSKGRVCGPRPMYLALTPMAFASCSVLTVRHRGVGTLPQEQAAGTCFCGAFSAFRVQPTCTCRRHETVQMTEHGQDTGRARPERNGVNSCCGSAFNVGTGKRKSEVPSVSESVFLLFCLLAGGMGVREPALVLATGART